MSDKLINLTIDFSSDKPVKITINMPKNEQKQEQEQESESHRQSTSG